MSHGGWRWVATSWRGEQWGSVYTPPFLFSRAEAFELLAGSKQLEMLSTSLTTEPGKAEGRGGPLFSTQTSNPSPSLQQHGFPPSMVPGLVAVLWDKRILFSSYSFLCLLIQLPLHHAFPLLNIYQHFPATDALSPDFLTFEYYFFSCTIILVWS